MAAEAHQEERLRLTDDVAGHTHHDVVELAVREVVLDPRTPDPDDGAVDDIELPMVGMADVVLVYLIRDTLHAGGVWYGAAEASWMAGMVAGSLGAGRVTTQPGRVRATIAGAAVACAGVAGFAALVTSTVDARRTAATKAVTEFLTDLQHDNYAGAYEAQCDELKQRLTFRAFTNTFSNSQIISFRLEEPEIDTDSTIVPVQLTFTDGTQDLERIVVVQDSDAAYRVCGDE